MIETSQEYQAAVYAPTRHTQARVVFSMVDPSAGDGAAATLPPGAPISRPDQVLNQRWDVTRRYGTYEPNYFKLDGSFVLPPAPGELPRDEVGWWSDALCDDRGIFDPPLVLTVNLAAPVTSPGVGVAFDRATGEHASDFDLVLTTGAGTITREVRGNTSPLYTLWETFDGYTSLQLVIHRWANPHRRARVAELFLGPVQEFGPSELIELTALMEIDPLGGSAPASELTFSVDNSDKRFNLLNPQGFYSYLRERQRITSQIGVEVSPGAIEWVDTGIYYLDEWASDEGGLTSSFTARDRLDLLDQGGFSATYTTPPTLRDVAIAVLQYAGVPSANYVLPAYLDGITTTGQLEDVSPRQALLLVAQAARCVLFVDREDRIRFVRLVPEVPADDAITYDNAYRKPRIEQEPPVGSVQVAIYDSAGDVTATHEVTTGQAGQTLRIENPLITSQAVADAVAQWVIAWASYRNLYTSEWRQNPALEVGDAVQIEDDFGQNLTSLVTSQEYRYNGALRGTTRTRGSW